MRFFSAMSDDAAAPDVTGRLSEAIRQGMDDQGPDLLCAFVSGHDGDAAKGIAEGLRNAFPDAAFAGCTAEGVIADGVETERRCGVAVMAAHLPGVEVSAFRLETRSDEKDEAHIVGDLVMKENEEKVLLVFPDPFSFDLKGLLDHANKAWPRALVSGGFASAARNPGGNLLFLGDAILDSGLVGLALSGRIRARAVVSQGCRPVGRPMIVTRGEGNVIQSLKGKRPMDQLRELAQELSPEDIALLRQGLFIGRAIDEYKRDFQRGDFLIQTVIGADPDSGAVAVAGEVRPGTTVQFHVRDAATADEDLRHLLGSALETEEPRGAFLFSCNGRGTRMWDTPGHDVSVLRELCPGIPVAGFFAAGEVGPVGGSTFVHGFTASLLLLSEP